MGGKSKKVKTVVMAIMIVSFIISLSSMVIFAKDSTEYKTISKHYVDEDEINILKKVETKDGFFCSKNTLEKYKNLEWIDVSQNNPQYSSKEGILYSKDGSKLLYCPPKYKGTVYIDENTTSINLLAFAHCTNVESYLVADNNQYLESEDGSLFSKGKNILHYVPDNKTGVYIISKEVEKIDNFAFIGSSVEEVIFAERDTILKYDGLNFSESKTLKRMIFEAGSEKYIKDTGVIWWYKPNGLVWADGPIVQNIEKCVFANKDQDGGNVSVFVLQGLIVVLIVSLIIGLFVIKKHKKIFLSLMILVCVSAIVLLSMSKGMKSNNENFDDSANICIFQQENKNKCAGFIENNQEVFDFLLEVYDDKKNYSVTKNKGKIEAVRGNVFIDNPETIEKWKALFDRLDCKFVLLTGKGENRELEIYLGVYQYGEKCWSEKIIYSEKEIPGAECIVGDWYFVTI